MRSSTDPAKKMPDGLGKTIRWGKGHVARLSSYLGTKTIQMPDRPQEKKREEVVRSYKNIARRFETNWQLLLLMCASVLP